MSLPAITLWADSTRASFVAGWQMNSVANNLSVRSGDNIGIELHWVQQPRDATMEEVIFPDAVNITLAVGLLDTAPTAGTYILSYGGSPTAPLAYNASASDIQTALNALAGITADGGVTVVILGNSVRVLWNNNGVPSSTLSVYENNLSPNSSIGIAVARAGSVSTTQITQLHIKQSPVALCNTWSPSPAPTITITQTHIPAYSGDYRVWDLVISPEPKSGTFLLAQTINGVVTYSQPINIEGLSASSIQAATGLTVSQVDSFQFVLSQAQTTGDTTVTTMITANGSGLIPYSSMYGVLNLNSLDMQTLLAGNAQNNAVMCVEVETDGKRQTLAQANCVIYNKLIDTDAYNVITYGDLIPADAVVRFDTAQTLTDAQKNQVKINIGALGASDLTSLNATVANHETRIVALEGLELTTDQRSAITGANAPTSTNVFATVTDLAGKANTLHTHIIAQVTGLQTALDGKANLIHTHTIADVSGLQTALDTLTSTKADTTATWAISSITGLSALLPTANEKNAMDASSTPSGSNPFVTVSAFQGAFTPNGNPTSGTFDSTKYPYELAITIGGTTYKIPARI